MYLSWRSPVDFRINSIEMPQAAEAGPNGNLGHGQIGLIQEALGALDAHGLRDLHGARSQMPLKEPAEMSRADAQSLSKMLDAAVVESTVRNQAQSSLECLPGAVPRRRKGRCLGSTPETGAKTGRLGGGGGRKERHIRGLGRANGTHWTAIDSGRLDPGENRPS